MKLYLDLLYISPYTYTVYSALREKEIPFEIKEVNFAANRGLDLDFSKKAVTDLIPVLEDGKFILSESLAILEYLEDKVKKPSLFPDSIEQRAHARMLLSWYRCGFTALREERSTETVFYAGKIKPKAPLSEVARTEIEEWFRFLSLISKPTNEFLFGTQWSIADTETALMLQRLLKNGEKIADPWKNYADRMWKRPSMKEFVERARPDFKSYYL